MSEAIFCQDCRHVIKRNTGESRDLPVRAWMCMRAPREHCHGFVSREHGVSEPYYRCHLINDTGKCCLFEAEPERPETTK